MKIILLLLGGLLSFHVWPAGFDALSIRRSAAYREARASGAEAVIRLNVEDESGIGVSNAMAEASFDMISFENASVGKTDDHGVCVLKNRTRGNAITLSVSKEGYYRSSRKLCLASMTEPHEVVDGKWLPDPWIVPMQLRRIRSRPEVVNFAEVLTVPVTNRWFGFDLKKGSFVGQGDSAARPDIEFLVAWDGLPPAKSRFCKLKMRFPGQGSGGYYSKLVTESAFPFAYRADVEADFEIKELDLVDRDGDPHLTKIEFPRDAEMIVRSRCVLDEGGRLASANYSSIRCVRVSPSWDSNPTLRLVYTFNPTVNDANLESLAR